jgi:ATP-binding cassette subfamily B protein
MTANVTEKTKPQRSLSPLLGVLGLIDRGQLLAFVCMLVALAAAAGITLGFGYVLKGLVDQGLTGHNISEINRILFIMVLMVCGLAIASFARLSLSGWLAETIVARLRVHAFTRLLTLDPAFYMRRMSHEVANSLSADTTLVGTTIATSLPLVMRNLLLVMGGIVMLVATSPRLTLMVLGIMPLVALPVIVIGRRVRGNAKKSQEQTGLLGGMMGETLSNIQTVQSYTAEERFARKYATQAHDTLKAAMRQILTRAAMASSVIFILFSSLCAVMWIGARDVMDGTISSGALASFVFYAALVASAFGILGDVGAAVFRAAAALERIREILNMQPTIISPVSETKIPEAIGNVQVSDLYFKYLDAPVIDGMSFNVRAGETVAIVGPSGAGKTTLFQLLMRFADAQSGSIMLDGRDIRSLPLEYLRGTVSYVPQDGALFSGTVKENILLGNPDARLGQIEKAARDAQAHDFIMALPNGYDTLLGERGMRLSGGQKQRIALTRALLKESPILLLDEATASLDTENEKAIQAAVRALHGKRTVMIIAHRLSTVLEADRIYVMQAGKIVEEGTHSELLTKNGVYARMVGQQFSLAEDQARRAHLGLTDSLH